MALGLQHAVLHPTLDNVALANRLEDTRHWQSRGLSLALWHGQHEPHHNSTVKSQDLS